MTCAVSCVNDGEVAYAKADLRAGTHLSTIRTAIRSFRSDSMSGWFTMRAMPTRYDRSRRRRTSSRCGRPTKKGTPCKLPQEIGRGCRHHATRAEREAAAEEAKARTERARQHAEQEQRTIRVVLALVTLTVFVGLGIGV